MLQRFVVGVLCPVVFSFYACAQKRESASGEAITAVVKKDSVAPVQPPRYIKPAVYPQHYFQSPVGREMFLAGNFAELRANHFHAGIDIKSSSGTVGDPVFAAADGYVSRIKIQAGGYGKALFITHPNGYTTVYGHLLNYNAAIEAYVKTRQYQQESYEIDVEPAPADFPVTKGVQVAVMGNTGASAGPHCHFEIRDSKTQTAVNPLLFGMDVGDNVPPVFRALKIYYINAAGETAQSSILDVFKKADQYKLGTDTLFIPATKVAFSVKAFDQQLPPSGQNGVYKLTLQVNDTVVYQFNADNFSFSDTRYINAHLDYAEEQTRHLFLHRLFVLPGDRSNMYDHIMNNGVVDLAGFLDSLRQPKPVNVKITAMDVAGNAALLSFWVKSSPVISEALAPAYDYLLSWSQPNLIEADGFSARFPAFSLYENLYACFGVLKETSLSAYSPTFFLHDYKTPVHTPFQISINPWASLAPELREKAFIAYCSSPDGKILNCGGAFNLDGALTAKVDKLGAYCILIDNTPPAIIPISFPGTPQKTRRNRRPTFSGSLHFRIRDNYNVMGEAKSLTYRPTLDGQWLLMEHDAKSESIFARLPSDLPEGTHLFKLEVKDDRGNTAVWERSFSK